MCGISEFPSDRDESHGVAYLIGRDQFVDVFLQENGVPLGGAQSVIDWAKLHDHGRVDVFPDHPYGKIVLVGQLNGRNVYSFTHPESVVKKQRSERVRAKRTASEAYLSICAKGLSDHLEKSMIVKYLHSLEGIHGAWTLEG